MNEDNKIHSEKVNKIMINEIHNRFGKSIIDIRQVDYNKSPLPDYIRGIDGHIETNYGDICKIQFKSSPKTNNLALELIPLWKKNNGAYYSKKHENYFIINTKDAEYFSFHLANGHTIFYSTWHLHVMVEKYDLFDKGNITYSKKRKKYLLIVSEEVFRELLIKVMITTAFGEAN